MKIFKCVGKVLILNFLFQQLSFFFLENSQLISLKFTNNRMKITQPIIDWHPHEKHVPVLLWWRGCWRHQGATNEAVVPEGLGRFQGEGRHKEGCCVLDLFLHFFYIYCTGCSEKNVFFSLSTATHPLPTYRCNTMRVYSHSYWLAMLAKFCTTIAAQCLRGRGGEILKILK